SGSPGCYAPTHETSFATAYSLAGESRIVWYSSSGGDARQIDASTADEYMARRLRIKISSVFSGR
ncbi:MAG: hypothetical protein OK454_11755, partial [Thaumarchaeota archaeon]|nr:hypothetical protein [Nitrososphaerota archaeon]